MALDHVIFTSRVGVRSFAAALRKHRKDVRLLGGTVIIAAGAGTAMLLSEHGLRADVVPSSPGSGGILQWLGQTAGKLFLWFNTLTGVMLPPCCSIVALFMTA